MRIVSFVVALTFVSPALGTELTGQFKDILDTVKEIARQRDEAIAQRDYWANRDCQDQYVMRFPQSKDVAINPDKAMVLQINEGADSKTQYTVVDSNVSSISICLLKVKDECILKYNGETSALEATRPLKVSVGVKEDGSKR